MISGVARYGPIVWMRSRQGNYINVNVVVIEIRYSSVERACCSDPVGGVPRRRLSINKLHIYLKYL